MLKQIIVPYNRVIFYVKKTAFLPASGIFCLLVLFIVGCNSQTIVPPTVTEPVSTSVLTDVFTATQTDTATPQPTVTATAIPTITPTSISISLRPSIPIPLPSMTPFPTITPDYQVHPSKPVFLSYGFYGGDGGSNTDFLFGRQTPNLIIYGDGHTLFRDGIYRESITFLETFITPAEMCELRQQLEDIGFLQRHSTFFTQREGGMGAGEMRIQVENVLYAFYWRDVPNLIEELAAGVQLIEGYRPVQPVAPYAPTYLMLWMEEEPPDETVSPATWPSNLPSLAELWSRRGQSRISENLVLVEGEAVIPIFELFSHQLTRKVFKEVDTIYSLIARPLLPHETPRQIGYYPDLPRDYVPVLNCAGEPALISPLIPTATPTLTAAASQLTGLGRILFVSGDYRARNIYVIEANGTNRSRLTYNVFQDEEPVWSPDGQQIAFTSNRTGNRNIFMMDANGTNVTQLTNHLYDDYSPTWSPDGQRIAFISDRDDGWQQSEIYVMNADGSQQQRLTHNRDRDLFPVWSPDGRKIVFVKEISFGQSYTLAVLFLDQEDWIEERMPFRTRTLLRPAWSPDSTQIAISLAPTVDEAVISILDMDGNEVQSFNVQPLELPRHLSWSSDGRYITFAAREPNVSENAIHFSEDDIYFGSWGIYALDITTEKVIQITFSEQDETEPGWWP